MTGEAGSRESASLSHIFCLMTERAAGEPPPTSSTTPVQLSVHSSGSQAPAASQKGHTAPDGSRMGLGEGPNSVPARPRHAGSDRCQHTDMS
jgi:hypothetical protein